MLALKRPTIGTQSHHSHQVLRRLRRGRGTLARDQRARARSLGSATSSVRRALRGDRWLWEGALAQRDTIRLFGQELWNQTLTRYVARVDEARQLADKRGERKPVGGSRGPALPRPVLEARHAFP